MDRDTLRDVIVKGLNEIPSTRGRLPERMPPHAAEVIADRWMWMKTTFRERDNYGQWQLIARARYAPEDADPVHRPHTEVVDVYQKAGQEPLVVVVREKALKPPLFTPAGWIKMWVWARRGKHKQRVYYPGDESDPQTESPAPPPPAPGRSN